MQRSKENLARWIESLAGKISQDPDRRVYERDGRAYFADPRNKYGPELRRLPDAVLQEGGWETQALGRLRRAADPRSPSRGD